jgi:hypothetical protein
MIITAEILFSFVTFNRELVNLKSNGVASIYIEFMINGSDSYPVRNTLFCFFWALVIKLLNA